MSKRRRVESKQEEEEDDVSIRCGLPLFALVETVKCACFDKCIACAHKICSGETLPPEAKANVRPESCPRSRGARTSKEKTHLGLYRQGSTILTVGDGDLSFSLALVNFLGAENVVATTYESRESIIRSYPDTGKKNLELLARLKCPVFHGVDAKSLRETLKTERRFDYVVFNFPCIATEGAGEDGQSQEMEENQLLLKSFGQGAETLLNASGQVHITHKTKAAFKNWGVAQFVTMESSLIPLMTVVFDRCAYPGYVNRKARDRKSFPVSDAVVFIFCLEDSENTDIADLFDDHDDIKSFKEYLHKVEKNDECIVACTRPLVKLIISTTLL